MKEYKFSKTYIVFFLYRFAFLLFVPFLQGLFFAHLGLYKLFTLYFADLLVVGFLFAVALVRYRSSRIYIMKRNILLCRGVFFKTKESTIRSFSGCVLLTQSLLLRAFKGVRIKFFSGAVSLGAYVKKEESEEISQGFVNSRIIEKFTSKIPRTLIMSASFSNALTGLLAAVPLLRRISAVLGARQTLEGVSIEKILNFSELELTLSRLSALIFLAWTVGFFTEFFREYGLSCEIFQKEIRVKKGLVTKETSVFPKDSVRVLVFRQSIIMFLTGLYSGEVRLNIKGGKIHLLSASSATRCRDLEDVLLKEKGKRLLHLNVRDKAILGYTYLPLLSLIIVSAVLVFFGENLFVKGIFSTLAFVIFLWFLFRIFALYRSSLSLWQDFLEVKYFSGMNFTRSVFKVEDVISLRLTQSIFQRLSGRCNLEFLIKNNRKTKIKIKHIEKIPALSILQGFTCFTYCN